MKVSSRVLGVILLSVVTTNFVVADKGDDIQPEVYVDISEKAQQDAVKYDGWRVIAGGSYLWSFFEASCGTNNTKRSLNSFVLTLGVEKAKKFMGKFIGALNAMVSIRKSQKEDGDWSQFNADYLALRGAAYSGNKWATCKTNSAIPEINFRAGYILKRYKIVGYIILGVARSSVVYEYYAEGLTPAKVTSAVFLPKFGIGAEMKINKKWGVACEWATTFSRSSNKNVDAANHQTKSGMSLVRLMVSFTLPNV